MRLLIIIRVAGGYRLYGRQLGGPDSQRLFDLYAYAGGRFWYLKMDMDVKIPPVTIQGFTLEAYTMGDSQESRDAFVNKRDAKF